MSNRDRDPRELAEIIARTFREALAIGAVEPVSLVVVSQEWNVAVVRYRDGQVEQVVPFVAGERFSFPITLVVRSADGRSEVRTVEEVAFAPTAEA